MTLEDVENISDPLQSVKPGLVSNTDVCLPLKSVHVRAKLVDLAAQVGHLGTSVVLVVLSLVNCCLGDILFLLTCVYVICRCFNIVGWMTERSCMWKMMLQQQLRVVLILPPVRPAVHTSLKITFFCLFFQVSAFLFVSVIQFIFILPTICHV